MPDRSRNVDAPAIDLALRALAAEIRYPPTPNLADSVRRRIDAPHLPTRAPWRLEWWRLVRRSSLAAVAALLVVVGVALAVGIGLRGLSIVFVGSSPSAPIDRLELGTPVTLSQARADAPFEVLVPRGELGEPDEVHVDEAGGVYRVNLVYRSGESASPDILITQFEARTNEQLLVKELGPETTAAEVSVRRERGFWVSGAPHVLVYLDASGRPLHDRVRLVGNVLVWERGDLTLRLEGVDSLEAALRIAAATE